MPARINAPTVTLNTEIPETAAASEFPPTAYRFLPKVVLFQMNQTMATAATAQRIMVGKPLILGIIMLGIADSMGAEGNTFSSVGGETEDNQHVRHS